MRNGSRIWTLLTPAEVREGRGLASLPGDTAEHLLTYARTLLTELLP